MEIIWSSFFLRRGSSSNLFGCIFQAINIVFEHLDEQIGSNDVHGCSPCYAIGSKPWRFAWKFEEGHRCFSAFISIMLRMRSEKLHESKPESPIKSVWFTQIKWLFYMRIPLQDLRTIQDLLNAPSSHFHEEIIKLKLLIYVLWKCRFKAKFLIVWYWNHVKARERRELVGLK